jgi:type II secretory ATPase GspE/PulE/Tfp pilus assembly ATPase PilB-like protein
MACWCAAVRPGKTTTLYDAGRDWRSELNVMTIEDPVEYVFPAVNQMQINLQADVTSQRAEEHLASGPPT